MEGAKWGGADLVKFQKRTVNKVFTKEELDKPRESSFGSTNRDLKEQLELNEEEYDEIDKFSKSINLPWFASVWDMDSIEFLKKYNLSYNKIPSPRLGHLSLLKEVANQKKYTYIATGMSTIDEIQNAVDIFLERECPFEIMHCNSTYPCPDEDLNLKGIETLRNIFKCKVGYSGHSPGILDGIIATVFGATSIEKHITLDRTMYGSDQPSSLEIHGFKKMVEYIEYTIKALGNGEKTITEAEMIIRNKLWREYDIL